MDELGVPGNDAARSQATKTLGKLIGRQPNVPNIRKTTQHYISHNENNDIKVVIIYTRFRQKLLAVVRPDHTKFLLEFYEYFNNNNDLKIWKAENIRTYNRTLYSYFQQHYGVGLNIQLGITDLLEDNPKEKDYLISTFKPSINIELGHRHTLIGFYKYVVQNNIQKGVLSVLQEEYTQLYNFLYQRYKDVCFGIRELLRSEPEKAEYLIARCKKVDTNTPETIDYIGTFSRNHLVEIMKELCR